MAAQNVASARTARTDGLNQYRVILESSSAGSVQAAIERSDTPSPVTLQAPDQGFVPVDGSDVDLEESMVTLLIGQRCFEANLSALEVQNDTLGSLMDILG